MSMLGQPRPVRAALISVTVLSVVAASGWMRFVKIGDTDRLWMTYVLSWLVYFVSGSDSLLGNDILNLPAVAMFVSTMMAMSSCGCVNSMAITLDARYW